MKEYFIVSKTLRPSVPISCSLDSNPGHSLLGTGPYLSAEVQLAYSTAPNERAVGYKAE